jgi:hypothetical protein
VTHISERKHAIMPLPLDKHDWRTASYLLYNLLRREIVVEHPVDVGEKVKVAERAPDDNVSSVWREFRYNVCVSAFALLDGRE